MLNDDALFFIDIPVSITWIGVLSAMIFLEGSMLVIPPGLLSFVLLVTPFWCVNDTTGIIGIIVFLRFFQGSSPFVL